MKLNQINKILILTVIFGFMSFASQASMAASADNMALNQDWHIALPAELPPAQPIYASLDQ